MDADCYFKSDKYIIRPHKVRIINGSEIILPTIPVNEMNWANLSTELFTKLQSNYLTGFTVIHNAEEMEKIMDLTKNLVKNANHELKLTELQYDSTSTSWWSGIFSAISIFGIVTSVIGFSFYKLNLLNCIIRTIIRKSTDIQMEPDGSFSFGLSHNIMPKMEANNTIHQQLNNHPNIRENNKSTLNGSKTHTNHNCNINMGRQSSSRSMLNLPIHSKFGQSHRSN